MEEYKIGSVPQIVVEESIDHKTGDIFIPPKLHYYKGEKKVMKIREFVDKFATKERLKDEEMIRTSVCNP